MMTTKKIKHYAINLVKIGQAVFEKKLLSDNKRSRHGSTAVGHVSDSCVLMKVLKQIRN